MGHHEHRREGPRSVRVFVITASDTRAEAEDSSGRLLREGAREDDAVVARVDGDQIHARIGGVLRGLLKDGIAVEEGIKAGDIDPRGEREYCYLISDKARAIAGGVLEAILHSLKDVALPSHASRPDPASTGSRNRA